MICHLTCLCLSIPINYLKLFANLENYLLNCPLKRLIRSDTLNSCSYSQATQHHREDIPPKGLQDLRASYCILCVEQQRKNFRKTNAGSENSGTPQITQFNRIFHYKLPSILGYPYFWKHPTLSGPTHFTSHCPRHLLEAPPLPWPKYLWFCNRKRCKKK